MIQVLFYGDKLDDGTRELLEIYDYIRNDHLTARMYKSIVYNLEFLRDWYTERKYAKAYVFSGDKVMCTIETRVFEFDDEDMIAIRVNQIMTRCYTRRH